MDYARIYGEFIADRKVRSACGYSEMHHIIPRSLGGGDDEENLIRLSAEDHLFAHLLLAKIHGGVMWAAAKAMVDMRGGTKCGRMYGVRPMFAIARKRHAEMMRGNRCPFADKTVFNLYHHDGRAWSGTKVDFRNTFGKAYQPISAEGHWKGWYQSADLAATHKERVRRHMENARLAQQEPSHDRTVYSFKNEETNEVVLATRLYMQRTFGLKPGDCCALVKGRQKVAKGFSLAREAAP